MTWGRVLSRNDLHGDYSTQAPPPGTLHDCKGAVRGDLRRLECDQRDDEHLALYAQRAGITPDQVKAVLDAFFEGKI